MPPDTMQFPAPRMLYGTIGNAGRGWKRVVRRAWESGWEAALEGIEWIDLMDNRCEILLGDAPTATLSPRLRTQPFFAAYRIHSELKKIVFVFDPACPGPISVSKFVKFRDMSLQAVEWPWYSLGILWPEGSFIKPYYDDDVQTEEKRLARICLKKIIPHFPLLAQLETRFSRDGFTGMPTPFPGMLNIRIMGVLCFFLDLGMTEKELMEIIRVPGTQAEGMLRAWFGAHQ
jgi:hypothetical protein